MNPPPFPVNLSELFLNFLEHLYTKRGPLKYSFVHIYMLHIELSILDPFGKHKPIKIGLGET